MNINVSDKLDEELDDLAETVSEKVSDLKGRLSDTNDLLDEIFEAAVAASEGSKEAAAWIVRRIQREFPDLSDGAARLLHRRRPADYWTHA